jgi:hypothetical protein
MLTIELIQDYIIKNKLAEPSNIHGISQLEIDHLQKNFGIILPSIYKNFLLTMGGGIGNLFNDVDFFYPEISTLAQELSELIDEEELQINLPKNSFIFSGYQGFQYHYFLCNGKSDPQVFRVLDDGSIKIVSNSFSEYLFSALQ